MAKQMKSFRCDEVLIDELDEYSTKLQLSTSDIIRQAVFSYLCQIKRQELSIRHTSNIY